MWRLHASIRSGLGNFFRWTICFWTEEFVQYVESKANNEKMEHGMYVAKLPDIANTGIDAGRD